ncbi:hypothetical protein GCM10009792_02600 [Microcella alkalica]|uniref:Cytoskeletal protein RodZ n=1 Tax=Microcella alkalica TaxID=355930 RepID=A0A839E6E5_9MICO|nr:hypothetical protein [Microcella alkalica]MBA8848001.1 cytoskeletal protein RodZ [Microcella alkalica]
MEFTGGGTAILIALAAGLWLVYLVPMWRRRTEYLSTERNALRLQQTLRIMAQTAELPEAVRAEMTAREVANQERTLAARHREEQAIARAREAAAQRAVRERLQQTAPGLAAEVDAAQRGQARVRRSRLVTSLLTLAAVIGAVASAATGAWAWTTLSAFIVVSGITLLVGLARATRRRSTGVSAPRRAPRFVDFAVAAESSSRAAEPRDWTPVPLPKPRYLAVPTASSGRPGLGSIDHTAVLAAAAAEAERAQRAATAPSAPAVASAASPAASHLAEAAPVPAAPVAVPAADATGRSTSEPVSRFARMGLLDGLPTAAPDLDEVLARRRAAG